jgi:hypothetical protein
VYDGRSETDISIGHRRKLVEHDYERNFREEAQHLFHPKPLVVIVYVNA